MDRGAWWTTVHGVAKSQTRLVRLSTHAHIQGIGSPGCILPALHLHQACFENQGKPQVLAIGN